jgi:hypothetical protein
MEESIASIVQLIESEGEEKPHQMLHENFQCVHMET